MVKGILKMAALCAALIVCKTNAGPVGVVPGRILVKTKGENRPELVNDASRPFSGNRVDEISGLGVHVVQVPEAAWHQALEQLRRHPDLEFAEPDYIREPDAVPNDP